MAGFERWRAWASFSVGEFERGRVWARTNVGVGEFDVDEF